MSRSQPPNEPSTELDVVEEHVVLVDPATTKIMKGNKRRDTKPELTARKILRELGYTGYRLDWKKAPGHPDIAFPGRKIAIFVNGCFWHHCPVCGWVYPKKNPEYWEAKLKRNVERDERNYEELRKLGWKVIVVWEHELKPKNLNATKKRLSRELKALF